MNLTTATLKSFVKSENDLCCCFNFIVIINFMSFIITIINFSFKSFLKDFMKKVLRRADLAVFLWLEQEKNYLGIL